MSARPPFRATSDAELAWQEGASHPWLERLFELRGIEGELDRAIHRDDAMLEYSWQQHEGDFDAGLATYFSSGLEVLDTIRQVARDAVGGFEHVDRFLDFGGGYGRVTRLLVRELAPERIWVADLLPEAVEFQRERFGVRGLLSSSEPETLDWAERFDFVWVGSLFTHLPEATFGRWLAALARLLEPAGVLAFTVHDARLVPPGHRLENGILFLPESESRAIDPEQYGSTWVSEAFVASALEQAAPALDYRVIPRGVCRHQDLYVVADPNRVDLDSLSVDPGPRALLEHCRFVEPGVLEVSGWACHVDEPYEVEAVELRLGDREPARCESLAERPDLADILESERALRSEFAFRLPVELPIDKSRELLSVVVRSSSGRDTVLFLGTLDRALYETARANWVGKRREVKALERHIEWMESSRFWKLRRRWFTLKRALGLTDEV